MFVSKHAYVVNLDHAVMTLPLTNIDIRNMIQYKVVMKEYGLCLNGATVK